MGMANGALALTETNDWLAAAPGLTSFLDTYEMPDYEHLGDVVAGALADPDRSDRTRTAYALVRDAHSWHARARTILDMVEV